MSDTTNDEHAHRRRHSQPLGTPYFEFDLVREIEHLHGEPEWKTGRNARTIVKYDNLRVVLTALKAHVRIPEHRTEGRISIQTIRARFWCAQKDGHLICRLEPCSRWTRNCDMKSRQSRTVCFS